MVDTITFEAAPLSPATEGKAERDAAMLARVRRTAQAAAKETDRALKNWRPPAATPDYSHIISRINQNT